MKNLVKQDHYYALEELERALEHFVNRYDNERYHESLKNLISADVHYRRGYLILKERVRVSNFALHNRRMEYQRFG